MTKSTSDLNPFLLHGYAGVAYFCDRKTELSTLKEAVANQRNVRLVSQRRMGKSALIHHFFKKQRRKTTIFVDIYRTGNQAEFLLKMTEEVANQFGRPSRKLMQRLASALTSVELALTYDPITGSPSIGASYRPGKNREATIKELFALLEEHDRPVIMAIDEFQNIADYPEKNTEALLREYVQRLRNVHFIFSGSNTRMMHAIFSAHNRPFYQSTEPLYLQAIPTLEYQRFIKRHFDAAGLGMPDEVMDDGLRWCRGHTFYVQSLFNRLYALRDKRLDMATYVKTREELLAIHRPEFGALMRLLSPNQAALLKAIAVDEVVKVPTAIEFILRHGLSAVSTVRQSLGVLMEKELLFQDDGGYRLANVFLSRWLATDI